MIMMKKWILKTYCGGIEPSAPLAGPHSCSSTGQQRLHLGGGGALEEGRGALEGALEGGGMVGAFLTGCQEGVGFG